MVEEDIDRWLEFTNRPKQHELNREQKESFTLLEIVDSPFKCYPMEYKGLKI